MRGAADDNLVSRAAELARVAHAGQFRRDGVTPYVRHLEAVASRVSGDPIAEAVAWLHDVLEDTDLTVDEMRAHQMPPEVIAGVITLTKKGDIGYQRYLLRIKADPTARKVKIADFLSNARKVCWCSLDNPRRLGSASSLDRPAKFAENDADAPACV